MLSWVEAQLLELAETGLSPMDASLCVQERTLKTLQCGSTAGMFTTGKQCSAVIDALVALEIGTYCGRELEPRNAAEHRQWRMAIARRQALERLSITELAAECSRALLETSNTEKAATEHYAQQKAALSAKQKQAAARRYWYAPAFQECAKHLREEVGEAGDFRRVAMKRLQLQEQPFLYAGVRVTVEKKRIKGRNDSVVVARQGKKRMRITERQFLYKYLSEAKQ